MPLRWVRVPGALLVGSPMTPPPALLQPPHAGRQPPPQAAASSAAQPPPQQPDQDLPVPPGRSFGEGVLPADTEAESDTDGKLRGPPRPKRVQRAVSDSEEPPPA